MTLMDVEAMDMNDFLKACEYVDMKDHVLEAGETDQKAAQQTAKPPMR